MLTVAGWYLSLDGQLVITSHYGPRGDGFHYGTDISRIGGVPPGYATPAPSPSIVRAIGSSETGWGNYVRLQQIGAGYHILIAHLANIKVSVGQEIPAMFNVGDMGSTGTSTAEHWHIEVWENGNYNTRVNPETFPIYLPGQGGRRLLTPLQIQQGRRILPRRRM